MHKLSAAATAGRVSVRTVLRTRVLLGYYCPLGTHAVTRCLAWLYCLSIGYFLSTLLVTTFMQAGFPLTAIWPIIIEYNGNVLISLLTGENHFFNYLKGIELIDREIGYNLPLTTPATVYIYFIVFSEVSIVWVGGVILLNNYIGTGPIVSLIINIARNVNYLIITLPLDLLRIRLQLLRQSLENNLTNSSLNNTEEQIKMLQSILKQYKKLIDNFNSTFNWNKLRIITSLSCSFFGFLTTGYSIIRVIKLDSYENFGEGVLGWAPRVVDFCFNVMTSYLPALFSELISREHEQLKITVSNLLLRCDDRKLYGELELAVNYLELRPFKISILRVVVLDGSLVLAFAGLCIAHLIVLIQITGLI